MDASYPLYGALDMAPAAPLADLLADDGAVVDATLLSRLGLKVGDRFSLGAVSLVVRGVVTREPDRPTNFIRLGPRVLVSHAAIDRSGLIAFGSRLNERWLLRLPSTIAPSQARAALAGVIDDPSIRIAAYDEAQPGLKRFLDQLAIYLGLIGLVSLLVGGVGVAASVATFMRRRRPTIAVLKCLGTDARTLFATYVVQTGLVGLAGSVAGAAPRRRAASAARRADAGTAALRDRRSRGSADDRARHHDGRRHHVAVRALVAAAHPRGAPGRGPATGDHARPAPWTSRSKRSCR